MKKFNIKLLLFFLIISTYCNASAEIPFDNMKILKKPKLYKDISFIDFDNKKKNLEKINSKIIILNFWATWCAPCIEEMPTLDNLQNINGVEIFPINIEKINRNKTKKFFNKLNIKNISIYFDDNNSLVNTFSLRGIPTTIFFNSEKKEFARIIGSVDFADEKFVLWLNDLLK